VGNASAIRTYLEDYGVTAEPGTLRWWQTRRSEFLHAGSLGL
jgi:hypothetical protein